LKVLRTTKNLGLAALAEVAGRKQCSSVYDLGFVLGPRINAGGRIGDSSLATRLLSTEDPEEARELAETLDALNTERRRTEAAMLEEAEAAALEQAAKCAVVIVGNKSWHPGIIGITAGRLKDRLMKPTIVLGAAGEDGPAKGSGRSTYGVNLGAAIAAAKSEGLLIAGGGHAMAAGLSIEWEKVDALREFLSQRLAPELEAAAGEARALSLDAVGAVSAMSLDLYDALERIGPYGPGHPDPLFALPDVRVAFSKLIKEEHVRFTLEDARGARIGGIAFRAMKSEIGEALMKREGVFHVAARLKRNEFNGRTNAEIEIVDMARAH
jgi:single-stranded-DNA-specific exonuclease